MIVSAPSRSVFVGGPITPALMRSGFDQGIRDLVERAIRSLEAGGFQVFLGHRERGQGDTNLELPEDLLRRDWRLARTCDAMVMVLPSDDEGYLFRTDGLFIEIGWASALRKPLFVLTDPDARDRSYIFDGLVRTAACTAAFDIRDPAAIEELVGAVRRALAAGGGARREVLFCATAFGFGPVSKVTAVADAVRRRRPAYRLAFVGSGVAHDFACSTGVYDEVVEADVDARPEVALATASGKCAVVNAMNFDVLGLWGEPLPPHFLLDSLAWLWPRPRVEARLATAYFVQDYLLDLNGERLELPSNCVLVPPIIAASAALQRAPWEARPGEILVNFSGCSNPFLPSDYYARYVRRLLEGLSLAARCIETAGARQIRKVTVCGNAALLAAAEASTADLPFPVTARFLPPMEFLEEMRGCDLFLTSPGLTATLEALALGVPVRFLLPQNLSQFRITEHYRSLGLAEALWPRTIESARLLDRGLDEGEGVRLIGELLASALQQPTEALAATFESLMASRKTREPDGLLSERLSSFDGADVIARRVIREVES